MGSSAAARRAGRKPKTTPMAALVAKATPYVFPYLRGHGVTDDDIRHVMVDNPRRLLTIAGPRRLTPESPASP
jgi:predicted metal-dependent phosphotriesterase family hydrolase